MCVCVCVFSVKRFGPVHRIERYRNVIIVIIIIIIIIIIIGSD